MSQEQQPNEAQLTLKDRLNMPYLLANQILTFQKSLLVITDETSSQREIIEAIKGFVNMIPDSWKDDKFKKEISEAMKKRRVDVRPDFCGLKPTEAYCQTHNIEAFKEEDIEDWYKQFQAVMNLLDRRGMLTKNQWIEELEGLEGESTDTDIFESKIQSE